jgi:hypothetical protein
MKSLLVFLILTTHRKTVTQKSGTITKKILLSITSKKAVLSTIHVRDPSRHEVSVCLLHPQIPPKNSHEETYQRKANFSILTARIYDNKVLFVDIGACFDLGNHLRQIGCFQVSKRASEDLIPKFSQI